VTKRRATKNIAGTVYDAFTVTKYVAPGPSAHHDRYLIQYHCCGAVAEITRREISNRRLTHQCRACMLASGDSRRIPKDVAPERSVTITEPTGYRSRWHFLTHPAQSWDRV
jgi:hypothetical protein